MNKEIKNVVENFVIKCAKDWRYGNLDYFDELYRIYDKKSNVIDDYIYKSLYFYLKEEGYLKNEIKLFLNELDKNAIYYLKVFFENLR